MNNLVTLIPKDKDKDIVSFTVYLNDGESHIIKATHFDIDYGFYFFFTKGKREDDNLFQRSYNLNAIKYVEANYE